MFRSVEWLLKPKSIAIVGASEAAGGGWAKSIFENLAYAGFPAKTYLINPKRTELWGHKVYPDFGSLGTTIDLALCIIPSEAILSVLQDGVGHGLKCAAIFASRFGEGGDPIGAKRAEAVKALSIEKGLRIVGPNCMGAIGIRDRMLIYPLSKVRSLPQGGIGVIFQSGGTFLFWMSQAAARGLGFSYAISSGNELDMDVADYINFMLDDEQTRMICCMVEGIRRPAAFMVAAEKALHTGKPILMVKIGASEAGRAAARSHTGALAGDDRVFNAVCEKFGVVRCKSLDDMIETALAFSAGRLPKGGRAAMVCASGGAKGLFLDYASEEGLEFGKITPGTTSQIAERIDQGVPAENPLDVGTGLAVRLDPFADVCRIICEDPNVDILALHALVPVEPNDANDASAFVRLRGQTDKPIIGFGRLGQNMTDRGREFQRTSGIPFLQGMPETVRAIKSLINYTRAFDRGAVPLPAPNGNADALKNGDLNGLLAAYDLPAPRSAVASKLSEVEAAAHTVGFPVALKIVSPEASHKTEVGGVAVNLTHSHAVREKAEQMAIRLTELKPRAVISGFLLQEMVAGTEFIVGVRDDPDYGPLIVAGLGGVLVEALQDVSIRLLPIDETTASEMLSSLKGRALFNEFRGQPARDVGALAKAMVGLSRLFLDHRHWISDIEINPLMVLPKGNGVKAVDVRIVPRIAEVKP